MKEKHRLPGELLLLTVLIINSMGVQLMTISGFGITAISSVPYVFSRLFPAISFGTFNYIFQTMLVISLMAMSRRISPGYIISFAAGFIFGKMLDVHALWMAYLPDLPVFRILYFAIGMLSVSFGICLANKCLLPIIPTDMFPRDFSAITKKSYKNVKTVFDISCLATTAILSLVFAGSILGIGIGTALCSLLTGRLVSAFQDSFDRHFTVYRAVKLRPRGKKRLAC
ncbi:DUF6198 family protein [Lachnospiraceae bacterium NSJ-143]|nr:DUF6198 family protein [Lachnospiraceae bacterium NSJ-143]